MTHGFFLGDDLFDADDRYDAEDRRFYGCCVGVVTNNKDPDGLGRVKVRFPWLDATSESHWARCSQIMAGGGRGWWNIPEIEDEVIVAFELGDVHFPYVIGHVWNGKDRPPSESSQNSDGKNDVRMYQSRSGHRLVFDDSAEAHVRLADCSGKNYVRLWNPRNKVEVVATDGDQFYKAPAKRIVIEAKNLVIKVKESATVEAGTTHTMKVGENAVVDVGAALTGKARAGSFKIDAKKGYTHKIGAALSMVSHSLNVFGSDSVAINTDGDLTFLSLLLVRLGVGVYQAKAPLFGMKMLLAQLTDGGDKMTIGGKVVSFDGLKLGFKSVTNKLKAGALVLVKGGKIHLNVGGPPAPADVKTPAAGFLAKLKNGLADLRAQLDRITGAINAALEKIPPQLRGQVQSLLSSSLRQLFGSFLPGTWAQAFADLFSGRGLTGPFGDLVNDLERVDYDRELARPGAPAAPGATPGGGPSNLPEGASWIGVSVKDGEGTAVPNVAFVVQGPDGTAVPGTTGTDGQAQVQVSAEGTCEVTFPDLENWELA